MLKTVKTYIFTLFVVTFFGSLNSAVAQSKQTLYENYIFSYEPDDSLLVRKLIKKIKPALAELSDFFDQDGGAAITIYLTSSQSAYRKRTQNKIPEWSQAVAFTRDHFIVMRLADAQEVKTAPQTLLHELTHMQIVQKVPSGRMPVWLNEGLAQYLSHKKMSLDDKLLLANKIVLKQLLPLSSLDSMNTFSALKARLAYVQALSAVNYFEEAHSRETLKQLVENIALYHSVNDAFRNTVGYDFVDFERHWYEDIKQKYRWLVVLNIDSLIWVFMGVLAILAIYVVRRRNRKKIEGWRDQEEQTAIEGEDPYSAAE